jgi:predicted alpha/beta hydrolase family esterase
MRYLAGLGEGARVGGCIFVAGFFHLPFLETEEEKEIAGPWLETEIDTDRVREVAEEIVAVFSDNDGDVPLSDSKIFKGQLDAEIIVEKGKGHFTKDEGVVELPVVLEALVGMQ